MPDQSRVLFVVGYKCPALYEPSGVPANVEISPENATAESPQRSKPDAFLGPAT